MGAPRRRSKSSGSSVGRMVCLLLGTFPRKYNSLLPSEHLFHIYYPYVRQVFKFALKSLAFDKHLLFLNARVSFRTDEYIYEDEDYEYQDRDYRRNEDAGSWLGANEDGVQKPGSRRRAEDQLFQVNHY